MTGDNCSNGVCQNNKDGVCECEDGCWYDVYKRDT